MSAKTVRVGVMPGRINEFVVETGTTLADLLALAELDPTGFDLKVDGEKVTDLSQPVTDSTNLVIMSKRVKGNSEKTVRVGQMPGRINEFIVDSGATFAEVLALAELNPTGFDIKADGEKVTDLNEPIGDSNLIILAKMVKGNLWK